MKLKPDTRTIP